MSTPNPLIPQGSIQHQSGSNVRIAVATVVAIHVVFFGGLLLQGCKRDAKLGDAGAETNAPSTALNYPAMNTGSLADTNSLYYQGANTLPAPDTNVGLAAGSTSAVAAPLGGQQATSLLDSAQQTAAAAQDPWKQGAAAATAAPAASAEPLGGKEYTVARGDTFARIAKAQGSTVSAITQANPTVDPRKIRPGMKLIVPAREASATPAAAASESAGGPAGTYTVKSGDNLTRIAKLHGVTIKQLSEANNLRTSRVNVGQKLKIPGKAAPTNQAAAPSANPTF